MKILSRRASVANTDTLRVASHRVAIAIANRQINNRLKIYGDGSRY
ncbi:hypothetical protein [Calothrix sp. PCC 7507]|nr:hypothetical protein [Calothrix sp. PCC 7507]